ncbi:MAG: 50S ribosomal protein L10 [Kiritimatiellae bacterium]|nr:50S ribosomal protein L10 [Kiritimatiellia bacterium]
MADELRGALKQTDFVVLTDFLGLTVEQLADLRARLRKEGAAYKVIKNRIFKIVATELGWDGLDEGLVGPCAMLTCEEDAVSKAAKILKDYHKENERPVIKLGVLKNRVVSADEIDALASLPSREVLLAAVAGTVAAPLSRLVGVMKQKVATLLNVLRAIEEKKGE